MAELVSALVDINGSVMVDQESALVLRRARAAFDGPFPVYALMAGTKIPLSAEECDALIKQSLSLAEQPSSVISSTMFEMLESNRRGVRHRLEISGLIKEKIDHGVIRKKVDVQIPHSCDQCGRDLAEVGFVFDACTIENMMWSWMCPPCFFALGCGVGEGFGQLYSQEEGATFLILGE